MSAVLAEDRELLRFTTAGSVDDGKSTLIGRLLYDSKAVFEDQYDAIRQTSEKRGDDYVNLALLTDGLRAEREQGITIDVAYRYFATPKRKFIIADTPGHVQYTRNMVTGASTANLAIILVDAQHGVTEQTRRHAFIASLLGIPQVVVCVNKMDLVGFDRAVFERIREQFREASASLPPITVHFLPISALRGDNVVDPSDAMPWYDGLTLLGLLEEVPVHSGDEADDARFPVQYVIRPQSNEHIDYRGYAGRVTGGVFHPGDQVTVQPSGLTSRIRSIDTYGGPLSEAFAPMGVTITLEDDIDISRGDVIVGAGAAPQLSQDIEAMVCWLNPKPLQKGGKYALQHVSSRRDTRCLVRDITHKVDIHTGGTIEGGSSVAVNEIARIVLRATSPLVFDSYRKSRATGSLILIDEATNETVGAAMIV